MSITLEDANRMIQAALAKASEIDVKVSIAVCDGGGNLIALGRMDGASSISAVVAQGKAAASAGFGRPSGTLQADSPVIQAVIAAMGGRMLPAQGAVQWSRMGPWRAPSGAVALLLNRTRSVPGQDWLPCRRYFPLICRTGIRQFRRAESSSINVVHSRRNPRKRGLAVQIRCWFLGQARCNHFPRPRFHRRHDRIDDVLVQVRGDSGIAGPLEHGR